jgi:hypothetical protein
MPLDGIATAEGGCRYVVDEHYHPCGAACRPGSSYCPDHHAICRLAIGSRAERSEIRLVEWIGEQVGGRADDRERVPPEKFMRGLEGRRR